MGFLKKVSNFAFGSTGHKYDPTSGASQHAGDLQSILGNITKTVNSDGSINTSYEASDIDNQRTSLAQQGLDSLSLDPTQTQQAYYDQASRLLNKNYEQQQNKMDERLINRGIQTGTKQYNDTIGALADSYNGTLNDLANQSVYMGNQNIGQQISNINSLTGGRDINTLAGMQTADSDAYDNAYQGKVYNDAMRNQRNSNIMSSFGALTGGFF